MWRLDLWEKTLMLGKIEGNRGWDGWMASLTHWTWVWANSRRQWRTGKPGVLQSMGSQRIRYDSDWTTTTNPPHRAAMRIKWDNTYWIPITIPIQSKFSKHFLLLTFVIQSVSYIWLFGTPWTAAHQALLSFTVSWSLLKLMPTESVMPSNHVILCRPQKCVDLCFKKC